MTCVVIVGNTESSRSCSRYRLNWSIPTSVGSNVSITVDLTARDDVGNLAKLQFTWLTGMTNKE